MAKYATGKRSWFVCGKCGMRGNYTDSTFDGQYPSLRVHVNCRDVKNPQERPFTAEDGIGLVHPVPDLDKANASGGEGATLINNLPPLDGGKFGGFT